jgi:hypothetical protein
LSSFPNRRGLLATLQQSNFLGEQTYVLADGSTVPSQTFRIRTLKVGNRIIEDVVGIVGDVRGPLLLGQSFLSRLGSWSIDNGLTPFRQLLRVRVLGNR